MALRHPTEGGERKNTAGKADKVAVLDNRSLS